MDRPKDFDPKVKRKGRPIYGIGKSWRRLLDPGSKCPWSFLADCLRSTTDGKYIKYNATAQQALLPSVTTLAGVLGWLVSKMKAAGTVQDIHIFTIAGAAEWAKGGASRSRSSPRSSPAAASALWS